MNKITIPKKSSFYSHKENCQCYPCKHKRGEKTLHKNDCRCATCKQKRGEIFGENSPMYGKHHTEMTKKKISLAKIGIKQPLDIILKRAKAICKPREIKKCKGNCGFTRKLLPTKIWKFCPECLKKIRIKNAKRIGKKNKGVKRSKEWHEKYNGKNNWNWKDGKSFELYSLDWTEILRSSIRERDHYTCQMCSIYQDELIGFYKVLDVHHIDYNKKNLNPNNLIALCRSCHQRTNFNREYWTQHLQKEKN